MKFFWLVLSILLLPGCLSIDMAELTLASTRDIDVNRRAKPLEKVVGQDLKHQVIVFPLGIPTIDAAIENALQNSGADYLTDVKLTSNSWFIPLIYGQLWIEAEGIPWKLED